MEKTRIRMISLGCAKNRVDSEFLLGRLQEAGMAIAGEEETADAVIVNTCSFLQSACEEAIDVILECAEQKRAGRVKAVLVSGCLPNRYGEDLAREMPEIDGVISPGAYDEVAEFVREALDKKSPSMLSGKGYLGSKAPRILTNAGHYAYIKISDGCDNRCSYCMIPDIRGPHASKSIEDVLDEAGRLVGAGVKELVVVAQDPTRYGTDLYGKPFLGELLKKIAEMDKLMWLRLMYAYPSRVDDELIGLFSDGLKGRLLPYLDLPMQHGSAKVLLAMNRLGNPESIIEVVEKLRRARPGFVIRTTFMVGFPGESESDFQELMDFIRIVRPQRAGVFRFSPEEGTLAASMPGQVPEEEKTEREREVMSLLADISLEYNESRIGEVTTVMVDGPSEESELLVAARSYAEAPEEDGHILIGDSTLAPGSVLKARITSAAEYDLGADVVE
ncbi:MAG TPA: 30S ribosomal protein S12 methylthiotransferase RimO [Bacillota bacterium]|nr:30S ribosomal protein S12 methylthiotransferase RimO [Bacillota bacterium]HOH10571.1 30S ribosomal protein S12 methylthiotransferase RimO [Bacillota bacterium]HOY89411.1 30S ribosomal protein S12 methylthiotransferase RimO [Bacillota bacterium]HPI02111.1 30S ribosomal protein S12 methylthiotransferase RimO [Bacillota bacterium]HPM63620.1 30S ribosomal protein S12 methylthiotransferase RimO [Bacillota bacterium]